MPTYPYRCRACEGEFELHQRITEAPATECSLCGAKEPGAVVRVIAKKGAFVLAGGGWAKDGY